MPDGTIFDRLEQIRKSLDANQRKALLRVVQSYKSSVKYLDSDIDLLVKELSGAQMSVRDVQKLKAYQRLMGNSAEALQQFASYLGIELRNEIDAMHIAGARDSVAVLGAYGKDIQALIRRVNPEQLAALRKYVDPGMPLYNRLQQFGKYSADYISQMILEGVKAGKNPVYIAKAIVDAEGMGLNDAVRMMRTVQVYAYRDANQASYQANSDIVRGWVWFAQLDDATCESCIAMHGTFHTVDETLDDHHNGRCTMLPQTILTRENTIPEGAGEAWFKGLPESQQQQIMGPGKWQAWKEDKFDFSQLSKQVDNDVFGTMRTASSLKDLVGE